MEFQRIIFFLQDLLKYITPFGYCEGADIVSEGKPDIALLAVGMALTCAGIAAAYWKYRRKDIS